ncbi:MAG: 4Fe-4S dicluster domain-containing protein, partial [Propionibacteriaceae bacterium]|nr:4Fe-4S dicluster domain-containing protein [Propionibacteriaceae bacterium]
MDVNRCTGCRSCEIACKQENQLGASLRWRRVREMTNEYAGSATMYFLSMACNHCEDPVCVKVCPTQALGQRDDGIVLIDDGKCIGCRYCQWACPYDALEFNSETGRMTKCTMCVQRVDAGQEPACVEGCPTDALQ